MPLLEEECEAGMPVTHVRGFCGILTNDFNFGYNGPNGPMIYIIRSDTGKRWISYLYNLSRYTR